MVSRTSDDGSVHRTSVPWLLMTALATVTCHGGQSPNVTPMPPPEGETKRRQIREDEWASQCEPAESDTTSLFCDAGFPFACAQRPDLTDSTWECVRDACHERYGAFDGSHASNHHKEIRECILVSRKEDADCSLDGLIHPESAECIVDNLGFARTGAARLLLRPDDPLWCVPIEVRTDEYGSSWDRLCVGGRLPSKLLPMMIVPSGH